MSQTAETKQTKVTVKAVVTFVSNWQKSKNEQGGLYKKVKLKDLTSGTYYVLYIYDKIEKTMRFEPLVKNGVCFEGLEIFKDNLISGFSEFKVMPKILK